jgi:hypothetical protein
LFVAGILAGVLAQPRIALAANDDPSLSSSGGQTASYSTGKAGGRLKWVGRPAEPTKQQEKAESVITPTQYIEPDPDGEPSCGVQPAQALQPSTRTWSKSLNDKKPTPTPTPAPTRPEKSDDDMLSPSSGKKNKPSLVDRNLVPQHHALDESCTSAKPLKKIGDITTDIDPPPPPPSWVEQNQGLPRDCPLGNDVFHGRSFAPITYTWTASSLCHKPLYFEDVQLERYGHMAGPWLQPFASAANFFCTIPILPYKMGLEPPNECMYTLGYYQPGSCAPYLFDPLPISVRGLFFEAGAWVGACAMFP